MTTPKGTTCPKCGLWKDTRKVSAIYNAGTFDKQSYGMSTRGSQWMSTGTSRSALAERLQPPVKKDHIFGAEGIGIALLSLIGLGVCLCGLVSVLCSGVPGVLAIADSRSGTAATVSILFPVFIFGVAIICFGITIALFRAMGASGRKNEQDWLEAKGRWDRLYYCGSCDSVFDPATGNHTPIEYARGTFKF